MKVKVLQINSVCGIGSTGRIATDIHRTLIEQGHESYIAYGRELPKNCDNTIKIGTKFDNYVHVAKTRILDKHGFGSKKATNEFIKKVKELDPDVIHLHNIHGYYINIDVLFNYLKEADKPVIWTLHDCWSFTGHCSHFDYIGCDKWIEGCFDCPQKREYPKSILLDNSRSNFMNKKDLFANSSNLYIIAVSEWLENKVRQSFFVDKNILTINNGIDIDVFHPKMKVSNEKLQKICSLNKFIILSASNSWNNRKGLNTAIEFSLYLAEDEVLVIVGVDRKQLRSLPPNIIGIEKTNNIDELVDIYSIADVFVNFSVEETFSMVTVEAMSCGTPVVVFNSTATPYLISEGCGYVAKKNNVKEMYNYINRVKENGKASYSKNCITRAHTMYNKKNTICRYIQLYENVINIQVDKDR